MDNETEGKDHCVCNHDTGHLHAESDGEEFDASQLNSEVCLRNPVEDSTSDQYLSTGYSSSSEFSIGLDSGNLFNLRNNEPSTAICKHSYSNSNLGHSESKSHNTLYNEGNCREIHQTIYKCDLCQSLKDKKHTDANNISSQEINGICNCDEQSFKNRTKLHGSNICDTSHNCDIIPNNDCFVNQDTFKCNQCDTILCSQCHKEVLKQESVQRIHIPNRKKCPSMQSVPFRVHQDLMFDLTFHSIPTTGFNMMGQAGCMTDVTSDLISSTIEGPPLDTVSLPPEVGELRTREVRIDTVIPGSRNMENSHLLRRTHSEPDVGRQRRVPVYGMSRHTRQTWYRRTTHSIRGSIAGSLCKFAGTTPSSGGTTFSLWSSTRQEKALLLCIALTNLCAMMCMSVMAPFFPGEAEEKGVNQMLAGWIFGVFALTEFIFAPICGKLVSVINPRFMFLAGQFFSGSCYILFGFMEYVPSSAENNTVYLTLCFLLRIFTAIGCCAAATATFTITAVTFPDNIATVFGLIETSTGLGMSLGPALGGVLYDAGGFMLPFVSLGAFMVIMVPVSKCMLPNTLQAEVSPPTSVLRLLRVPAIDVTMVCVFVAAVVWSVLDPTLQPHLILVEGYNLTSTLIGLIFLLMSAIYGIFCPLFGVMCDHMDDTSPVLIVGFLIAGIGMLLLGPSPHLGFANGYNELWLNLVALIVLGFALSLAIVPTFDKILDAADKAGFDDNFEMYGVVAGLWGSAYAFGDFVGPSLGGFLAEHYSFPWCMTYIGYSCWAVAVCCMVLWLYERTWGPTQVASCCGSLKDHADENKGYEQTHRTIRPFYEEYEREPLLQLNGPVHYG